MKSLKIIKLKIGNEYNVIVDDDVVGRMSIINPTIDFSGIFTQGKENILEKIPKNVYTYGDVSIDGFQRKCFLNKKEMYFTKKEFDMVYLFASRPTECIHRLELEKILFEETPGSNSIDVHIKNIRKKLDIIETVRGLGHRLKVKKEAL